MGKKISVEELGEDVTRLTGEVTDNLVTAIGLWGEISDRWTAIEGDLKNATDDDCRYLYERLIQMVPEANKIAGRNRECMTQLNNIRRALGLSEGDVPPCEC